MVRNTHIFDKNVMIFTVLSHLLIRVKKHKKKTWFKTWEYLSSKILG